MSSTLIGGCRVQLRGDVEYNYMGMSTTLTGGCRVHYRECISERCYFIFISHALKVNVADLVLSLQSVVIRL